VKVQRAEVRFDGLAGCLRTPRGGSSRQTLLVIEGGEVRSRLLSGREGARLMGLPDTYRLPARANGALHVVGDGVAAPVVRWLSETLLTPLLVPPLTGDAATSAA
jgi:DNA (cytosine-5)-methyltransferase 1